MLASYFLTYVKVCSGIFSFASLAFALFIQLITSNSNLNNIEDNRMVVLFLLFVHSSFFYFATVAVVIDVATFLPATAANSSNDASFILLTLLKC